MIKPIGEYILVEAIEESQTTESGLIIQSSGKEKPQRGTVVALGNKEFSVKEGDVVLFKKYTPEEVEFEGKEYLLMKEVDILAVYQD